MDLEKLLATNEMLATVRSYFCFDIYNPKEFLNLFHATTNNIITTLPASLDDTEEERKEHEELRKQAKDIIDYLSKQKPKEYKKVWEKLQDRMERMGIYPVVKPKGKLLIFVPFLYCLHEVPHDYHRYTQYYFENVEKNLSASVQIITPLGGIVDVLLDLVNKTIIRNKHIINILVWISNLSILKKYNRKSSSKFPTGYFVLLEKDA